MFIRRVIEVLQVHLGWRENFVSGYGGAWGFPTLHCLPESSEAGLFRGHLRDLFVFPFSEWGRGVPKDVLSAAQLFPRFASCAHFRAVL